MERQITLLEGAPITKAAQNEMAEAMVARLLDGEINPLEFITKVKAVAETCTKIIKDPRVVDKVDDECNKYGKGEQPAYAGAKIQMAQSGGRYDYSACGDPTWNRLSEEIAALTEKLKDREATLKTFNEPQMATDMETGEEALVYPPSHTSTTTVKIIFAK